ncbi:DUF4145 domain-containing protein [Streptomyces sp. NBC_01433]|uniref:DUF4145 domain-containing protein n=1 Tax=Streptomyces sp. NBC_01433 TaxID=2903864 RepID=UPI00225A8EEF|nr:DUF4145 domain-containing protein [Streptomyces sp. NBC_01433]MCX4677658.1 DUF4145 domain-containing protein [Streptomyces sp. NBC_01433]
MNVMSQCGWCGVNAVMLHVGTDPSLADPFGRDRWGDTRADVWELYVCPGCNRPSLAHRQASIVYGGDIENATEILRWWPARPPHKEYPPYVPEEIAQVASEAYACADAKAHRGAIILARSVVEATAKDKGITTGGIAKKIEQLFERGLIYEHVRNAAHEIRHAGNEIAHADLAELTVDEGDAEALLELMDMVLDGVYIAPGKAAAQAHRREERKTARALAKDKPV